MAPHNEMDDRKGSGWRRDDDGKKQPAGSRQQQQHECDRNVDNPRYPCRSSRSIITIAENASRNSTAGRDEITSTGPKEVLLLYQHQHYNGQVSAAPWLNEKTAVSELPPPATSKRTAEMRPRRRLIRLLTYCLFIVGITKIFYSILTDVYGAPSEPGVNLNSSKRLGYRQLGGIPSKHVPTNSNTEEKRLVFIGDVHGMFTELKSLLLKINYDKHTDHIVFTGDLVTKGPDSLKVIDFARNHGASCVRGNQDDRVLLHYHHYKSHIRDSIREDDSTDLKPPVSASEKKVRIEKALARKMTQEQAEWLDSCPLILRADGVKGLGDIAVVHAGLVHGVLLEQQDPAAIMTMRSIHPRSRVPSSGTGGTHWASLWNRYEKHERVPLTVIYGHYAAKGLDIRPLSKGLDSNCVRGGALTALVASTRTDEPKAFSVRCRKTYDK